jgi:hypothetical protein
MKYRPVPSLLLVRRLVRSIDTYGLRGAFVDFYRRLIKSLRKHGFSGTFKNTFRDAPPFPEDPMP